MLLESTIRNLTAEELLDRITIAGAAVPAGVAAELAAKHEAREEALRDLVRRLADQLDVIDALSWDLADDVNTALDTLEFTGSD